MRHPCVACAYEIKKLGVPAGIVRHSKESLNSRRLWNPTLRKVREGWGTPCVAYADEIKRLGLPPRLSSREIMRAINWLGSL